MGTYIIKLILPLLLGFLLSTSTAHAERFEFNASNTKNKNLESVRFINGITIKSVRKDRNSPHKLIYLDASVKSISGPEIIENDYVTIESAYPSAQSAQVSVISSQCGGSMCGFSTYYLAYLINGALYVHEISTDNAKKIKITGNYNRGNITNAVATNVTEPQKNQYGDTILGTRILINKKGFVKSPFKRKYLPLVEVHPEDYFSNKVLRENLAKQVGFENFKVLRSYMQVASNSKLVDGQYIVISGMLPHSGADQSGVVVIDGVNKKYYALWVDIDSNKIDKGATAQWTEHIARIVSDAFFHSDYFLSFENDNFSIRKLKQ